MRTHLTLTVAVLAIGAIGVNGAIAAQDSPSACCKSGTTGICTIVASPASAIGGSCIALCLGEDDQVKVELPDVWIGVRLAPVPAPLAAHLGRDGLMVANVIENSPADDAGVERYDVIVSFDGEPIDDGEQLVDAVVENGAGKPTDLEVIRGGQKTVLQITPAARPEDPGVSFKYEEPDEIAVDDFERYFGHNLRIGPDGNVQFEPLGRLRNLRRWFGSDDFKAFHIPDFDLNFDWDDDLTLHGKSFAFRFGHGSGSARSFVIDSDDDEAEIELKIVIEEDGERISIHRSKDGKIEVRRTDEDGTETVHEYEDVEQLEQEDPDAFGLYRGHVRIRRHPMVIVPPDLKRLPMMQRDFERVLEEQLEKAREAIERAKESIEKAAPEDDEQEEDENDDDRRGQSAPITITRVS